MSSSMKWCYSCRHMHLLSEFSMDCSRGDGLSPTCKNAQKARSISYRSLHRDELNAKARARRAAETAEEKDVRRARNRLRSQSQAQRYQEQRRLREAKQAEADPIAAKRKKQERYKKHYTKHRDHVHNSHLKGRYGITLREYDAMLAAQGGVCAICNSSSPSGNGKRPRIRFSVDHDHETNTIRGLICGPCNLGLGSFRDNPISLRAAADYIERHRGSRGARTIQPIKPTEKIPRDLHGRFSLEQSGIA
jgi:hypothetical protein